jgi:hypothetical protein
MAKGDIYAAIHDIIRQNQMSRVRVDTILGIAHMIPMTTTIVIAATSCTGDWKRLSAVPLVTLRHLKVEEIT